MGLVQARMGSTRLPGKVMKPLAGKPLVWHIIERLLRVHHLDKIVLATTVDVRNDGMVDFVKSNGIPVYREIEENDICRRLINAAREHDADAIVKINGDCPIVDIEMLNDMVDRYRKLGFPDYLSNKVNWTFPKGLSTEIISTTALDFCDKNLTDETDRELVCDWIKGHPTDFSVHSFENDKDLSHFDWMVDTPEDYELMRQIFDSIYDDNQLFGMIEVLNFIKSRA